MGQGAVRFRQCTPGAWRAPARHGHHQGSRRGLPRRHRGIRRARTIEPATRSAFSATPSLRSARRRPAPCVSRRPSRHFAWRSGNTRGDRRRNGPARITALATRSFGWASARADPLGSGRPSQPSSRCLRRGYASACRAMGPQRGRSRRRLNGTRRAARRCAFGPDRGGEVQPRSRGDAWQNHKQIAGYLEVQLAKARELLDRLSGQ